MVVFTPLYQAIGTVPGCRSIAELEQEQGVYSATPEFVRRHCGPVAIGILDKVPAWYFEQAKDSGLHVNIDVRVQRLYPGDFPAYPGWHCDGQYRETYFSQPDPDRTAVAQHLICTVSTDPDGVSLTQFAREPVEFESSAEPGHTLWGQLDSKVRERPVTTEDIPDGQLTLFDSWTPHRATAARVRGWRLFFRMAMWYRPNLGEGKLSRQEQVYKLVEGTGW